MLLLPYEVETLHERYPVANRVITDLSILVFVLLWFACDIWGAATGNAYIAF